MSEVPCSSEDLPYLDVTETNPVNLIYNGFIPADFESDGNSKISEQTDSSQSKTQTKSIIIAQQRKVKVKIYLGSIQSAIDPLFLQRTNITAIINLCGLDKKMAFDETAVSLSPPPMTFEKAKFNMGAFRRDGGTCNTNANTNSKINIKSKKFKDQQQVLYLTKEQVEDQDLNQIIESGPSHDKNNDKIESEAHCNNSSKLESDYQQQHEAAVSETKFSNQLRFYADLLNSNSSDNDYHSQSEGLKTQIKQLQYIEIDALDEPKYADKLLSEDLKTVYDFLEQCLFDLSRGDGASSDKDQVKDSDSHIDNENVNGVNVNDKNFKSKSILIHCVRGQNRSSCILVAYLMKKLKWSADDTIAYVRQRRANILGNQGFVRKLRELDFG